MRPVKPTSRPAKPALTNAERHKRFVETAKKVEASEDPKDFERALAKIIRPKTTFRS
jgi:hypothetical protein